MSLLTRMPAFRSAWVAGIYVAIAAFALLLIGGVWAVALERINFERDEAVRDAYLQNSNLAIAFEQHAVASLKSIDQLLLLVRGQLIEHGPRFDLSKLLSWEAINSDSFTFVGVVNERGDMVQGSADYQSANLADREYFRFHRQNDVDKMFVGKPLLGRLTGKWAMQLSRRIYKPDGSFGGIVYVALTPAYFTHFYQKADLGTQGLIELVGLDGIARARRVDSESSFGEDMRKSNVLKEQAKHGTGNFLSLGGYDGVPRFISYRALTEYPLIVAVGTSQAATLAPFHVRERNYYAAAALASVLTLVFAAGLTGAIARQRRAIVASYRSDARFSATFNQAAVGIAYANLDLKILDANPRFCGMLGYSKEELLGRTFLAFTHPDDVARSSNFRDRLLADRTGTNAPEMEKRYLRKDGSTIWVMITVSLMRDSGGNPDYFITVIQDITERKRAEIVLADSERRFRSLIENAADLLVVIDPRGAIKYVSPSVTRLFGYAGDEVTGRSILDFTHPDDVAPALADISELVRDPRVTLAAERRFRHKDGSWVMIESIAKNALDDPVVAGIVINARDVTERRRTVQELELKNTVLSTQQETSPDAILLVDENAKIVSYNRQFMDLWGISEEKVRAGDDEPVLRAVFEQMEDPAAFLARVKHLYEHREEKSHEEIRLKDGRIVDRYSSSVIGANDRYYGRIWYFRDITRRKETERTLLRVTRAHKVLSGCNGVLVRATDETQLTQDICSHIVGLGDYLRAWVGFVEHDEEKTVRPVAYAGYEKGFMEQARVTWADTEYGRGPIGVAVRTGIFQVVQNAHTDPAFRLWHANAEKLGYGSLLALPLISAGHTLGALTIYASEVDAFNEEEMRLLSELADDLAYGIITVRTRIAHGQSEARLLRSMEGTILAMAATLEIRDAYTAGHQHRVAELAVAIARELGLPEDEIHGIYLAAVVHDLGKIQIPAEILSKPTRLTPIEYELIKTHPEAGYNILKEVEFPWPIAQIVYQHHERLDGSGYPRGLKDAEILIGAKILAVADTVEAMSAHRPYRPGFGIDKALEEIMKQRARIYDAAAVDACVKLFREKRFAFST